MLFFIKTQEENKQILKLLLYMFDLAMGSF